MGFQNLTPAQRAAMREKAKATRLANKQKRLVATGDAVEEISLPRQDAYGSAVEQVEDDRPPIDDHPADPFQLFVLTLDPETRELFTADELREIYDQQMAKALAEKRVARKKTATDLALSTARMSQGLVPKATAEALAVARRNAEAVKMKIELPPCGPNGEVGDVGLRIDGVIYEHGKIYPLTRGQADSFKEVIYNTAQMELSFQGQNVRQRRWMLGRAMGHVESHIMLKEDGTLA